VSLPIHVVQLASQFVRHVLALTTACALMRACRAAPCGAGERIAGLQGSDDQWIHEGSPGQRSGHQNEAARVLTQPGPPALKLMGVQLAGKMDCAEAPLTHETTPCTRTIASPLSDAAAHKESGNRIMKLVGGG
jgi:hypothetical protein